MYRVDEVVDRFSGERLELMRLPDGELVVRNPRTRRSHRYREGVDDFVSQQGTPRPPHASTPMLGQSPAPVLQRPHTPAPQFTLPGPSRCLPALAALPVLPHSSQVCEWPGLRAYLDVNFAAWTTLAQGDEPVARYLYEGALCMGGLRSGIAVMAISEDEQARPMSCLRHASGTSSSQEAERVLKHVTRHVFAAGAVEVPRVFLVGGNDRSGTGATNLLRHKERYNIVGAKLKLTDSSHEIACTTVALIGAQIYYCVWEEDLTALNTSSP